MADNSTLPATGDVIRDKDRAGVRTQLVGLDLNPAGAEVLGTGDATNGLDVDVTRVPSVIPLTTATIASVASSAASVTLKAANAARRQLLIQNDSTAILYLKYGATATAASWTVKLAAGDYWEMPQPIYTGVVDGIWVAANGVAAVTEGV